MTDNLPSLLPNQQEFNMFQVIAKNAQGSGLYAGVGGESKIFMVLLAARELGISPMLALNGGIWNISGRIEISARLMNSMIRRGGHTMKIVSTSTECSITGKRSDTGEEHTEIFTIAMAERAGLASGNVWKKYPEDMLYNRCMSRLARRLFPDVIGTAYVEGEIKEAKDVERLEQVDCEDVTKPNMPPKLHSIEQQIDEIEEVCMDEESLNILLDTLKQVDAECSANFYKWLSSKYASEDPKDLPQNMFDAVMRGFSNNLMKKTAVA